MAFPQCFFFLKTVWKKRLRPQGTSGLDLFVLTLCPELSSSWGSLLVRDSNARRSVIGQEQQAARKRTVEAASKGGDGDKVGDDAGGDQRRAKRARLGESGSDNNGTRWDADRRGRGERMASGRAYEEDGVVEGDSGEAMEVRSHHIDNPLGFLGFLFRKPCVCRAKAGVLDLASVY